MTVNIEQPDVDEPQEEVVSFPRGVEGAHQIVNRSDDTVRFLAFERRPDGGGLRLWFRTEDAVDYYEGGSAPG